MQQATKKKAIRISRKKISARIREFFQDQLVIYSIILTLVLVILVFVIFFTEHTSNSSFHTLFDAFWYALVTITTVGYGDITPVTIGGRIAGFALLLFGVIAFGAISGKVASVLFDQQRKKDKGLIQLKKMTNHFLICGFKTDFDLILDGIIKTNPDIPLSNFVLINEAPASVMEKIKSESRFKGLTYVFGDFTDEAVLTRARIRFASRVMVLSDVSKNFSELEIDSRTVLAVLTISNLNPKIYITAELINTKFEKHLSVAHCDEIILSRQYERNLIVSASSGTGVSHILLELINEDSGEGLVIEPIKEFFIGRTYAEYRHTLKTNGVLIGLLENTGNFYHRRREALSEAQKNPDMKKIVTNLQKVKKLESNKAVLSPPDDYVIKHNTKAVFIYGKKVSVTNDIETAAVPVIEEEN